MGWSLHEYHLVREGKDWFSRKSFVFSWSLERSCEGCNSPTPIPIKATRPGPMFDMIDPLTFWTGVTSSKMQRKGDDQLKRGWELFLKILPRHNVVRAAPVVQTPILPVNHILIKGLEGKNGEVGHEWAVHLGYLIDGFFASNMILPHHLHWKVKDKPLIYYDTRLLLNHWSLFEWLLS